MRRASALLERLAAPPVRATQERYRHELKYPPARACLSSLNTGAMRQASAACSPSLSGYTIRSLYFDDYCNSAYEEKDAGILMRKKYRVRIYNGSDKVIKLERKKKYGSWIYKEDASLTRGEFEQILAGDYDFLLRSPYPVCREFYIECICNMMRPRTIVDYEREPWVMDEGTVRITFDSNVRAAVGSFDIFDATLPALPVLEPGKLVMEVKYTEFCPQLVRDMVPPGAAELTAVSKYCLCYDKTAYLRGFNYWESDFGNRGDI